MKRLSRIFTCLMVAILLAGACFSFTGCAREDIVKVELKISVFNYTDNVWYDQEDTVITVDLYRHLAPDTVDAIVSYINDGYYDDAVFYCNKNELNKIFVGDLKMSDSGRIYQNEIMPMIDGEFTHGGTVGNNLEVTNGNIGLWRTWTAENGYRVSNNQHTGRATWFMPTNSISSYNDYFCVFAVIDMSDETNANTWEYIKTAVMTEANAENYVVYYTGEYQENGKENENYGLEFHCEEEVLAEHKDDVFYAKDDQFVLYDKQNIMIAKGMLGAGCGAKIVSAKVVD